MRRNRNRNCYSSLWIANDFGVCLVHCTARRHMVPLRRLTCVLNLNNTETTAEQESVPVEMPASLISFYMETASRGWSSASLFVTGDKRSVDHQELFFLISFLTFGCHRIVLLKTAEGSVHRKLWFCVVYYVYLICWPHPASEFCSAVHTASYATERSGGTACLILLACSDYVCVVCFLYFHYEWVVWFFLGKWKTFSFFLQSQPDSLCISVSDFLPDSVCSAQLSLDSVKNRPQACGLCKAEQGAACGMHLKTQWHTLTVLECCLQLPQSAVAAAAYLEHGGTWCAGWIFGSRFTWS